jgi:hypothetical protein
MLLVHIILTLRFFQDSQDRGTIDLYSHFEDVWMGTSFFKLVDGDKIFRSETLSCKIKNLLEDAKPVFNKNGIIKWNTFLFFLIYFDRHVSSVFYRLGSTWMHGVYSFGLQHHHYFLFAHLDSLH